jgi:hypothetical protein
LNRTAPFALRVQPRAMEYFCKFIGFHFCCRSKQMNIKAICIALLKLQRQECKTWTTS